MRRDPQPKSGGIAGLLFVFCLAALIAGLGFDYGAGARSGFWIGAQAGAAAAVGAGATLFVIACGRLAQVLFGKRRGVEQGDDDARSDA